MYVCIKCYEKQHPNVVIYKYPGEFICPRHGLLPKYNGYLPLLNVEQIGDDKEIFPMSTEVVETVGVADVVSQNGTGEQQFDARTGMKIIQLGEGHFATERTDQLTAAKIQAMKTMPNRAVMDRNNQGKYRYTSFNQFIEHTREYLLEAGIVLTPSILKMERASEQNGTIWVWITWKIEHYKSGQWEQVVIPSFANNQDKGYKHLSKALSYNIKDMLRMVFMVPSGDEDDPDDDSTQEEWRTKYEKLHRQVAPKIKELTDKITQLWNWLPDEIKSDFTKFKNEQAQMDAEHQAEVVTSPPN